MASTETRPQDIRAWPPAPRWLWPSTKALLILAVVAAVGWQFAHTLGQPDLWAHPPRPHLGLLALAAVFYLIGLGFPALFWYWLLRVLGQQPHGLATVRAYYVGQLGRYVPGKMVGLGMRARLLVGPGVPQGVAVLSVVYESLTTIVSGVLLALLLLAFGARGHAAPGWRAVALLLLVGGVLLPGVFNRLADRTSRPFRAPGAAPLPQVCGTTLVGGLAITACGWLAQGGTLWVLVEALAPGTWPGAAEAWGCCTAYAAMAYAAGFLVLAAPGGLGVRDFLIQQFLAADLSRTLGPEQAAATAVMATLLLRLLWTVLDVAAAGLCWWLPDQTRVRGERPRPPERAVRTSPWPPPPPPSAP
jgi:hypothetical protein